MKVKNQTRRYTEERPGPSNRRKTNNGEKTKRSMPKVLQNAIRDWVFANLHHPYPPEKVKVSWATEYNSYYDVPFEVAKQAVSMYMDNGRRRWILDERMAQGLIKPEEAEKRRKGTRPRNATNRAKPAKAPLNAEPSCAGYEEQKPPHVEMMMDEDEHDEQKPLNAEMLSEDISDDDEALEHDMTPIPASRKSVKRSVFPQPAIPASPPPPAVQQPYAQTSTAEFEDYEVMFLSRHVNMLLTLFILIFLIITMLTSGVSSRHTW